ncbi:MAG: NUDIX domain-containing protein [Candidatus Aenigmarchaeota archaeon]|nr:NUDIX domain-containing protein [Candidatus Aenigmarchaeota archaeon]
MASKFIVPQKAVIMDGVRFLILKRSVHAHAYPNRWDFPGGKLETGEDAIKSLEREVLEETGLKVRVIRPVFTFHETVKDPVVFIVYECERLSGEIRLSHEHTEYRWATRQEILRLDTVNFLRAFLNRS